MCGKLLRIYRTWAHLSLIFSPRHVVNNTGIALDDFNDLDAHVFVGVVGHRDTIMV